MTSIIREISCGINNDIKNTIWTSSYYCYHYSDYCRLVVIQEPLSMHGHYNATLLSWSGSFIIEPYGLFGVQGNTICR